MNKDDLNWKFSERLEKLHNKMMFFSLLIIAFNAAQFDMNKSTLFGVKLNGASNDLVNGFLLACVTYFMFLSFHTNLICKAFGLHGSIDYKKAKYKSELIYIEFGFIFQSFLRWVLIGLAYVLGLKGLLSTAIEAMSLFHKMINSPF